MNLIDGLILSTLQSQDSRHSLLMDFYHIDAQIADWDENIDYQIRFHSLEYTMLRIKAKTILYTLNIL